MIYKQCKFRRQNVFTHKWVNEKIAKLDEVMKIKERDWIICKIWHVKQDKKYLADIHLIG